MDKMYLGTNTKMNKTIVQTKDYLETLVELVKDIDMSSLELFVIPSFTTLHAAAEIIKDSRIVLGAQNMCWEDNGAFTGEISPLMLEEVGVKLVEIGHSERRHIMGETDEMENRKVLCALRHDLNPLLCIGETEAEKKAGRAEKVIIRQMELGLFDVPKEKASMLRIAYEPVWSIGINGTPVTKEYAQHMSEVIRSELTLLFDEETSSRIPVIYGGSVNNENAVQLASLPQLNGLFIGRSAWDANNFNSIIRNVLTQCAS